MMHSHRLIVFTAVLSIAFQAKAQTTNHANTATEVQTTAGTWHFSLYPHNIIKASFEAVGSDRNEQVSNAVIARPLAQAPATKRAKDNITLDWNRAGTVEINKKGVLFINGKNAITLSDIFYTKDARGFRFLLKPGEKIFGTGERSTPLNRRGYKVPLNNAPHYGYGMNTDTLNFCVPFILSDEGYAIFFDNPSVGYLDIGKKDSSTLEYSVCSGELSFYIIPGDNYEDILRSYQSLVGTAPLPPRWALGNLMSRFGYRDEQQARATIAAMKKDSVPFDAIIFDLFWFGDSIQNTLGNLAWINKTAWPDPKKMMADFKKENIKTILIAEPFVLKTSLNYHSAEHLLATDSTGNPYTLTNFYFGKGGIIDIFSKDAQKWFYHAYKTQMDLGVSGWWGDLGEPETHPADVYHNLSDLGFRRRFAAAEVHNIYGHFWSKMLAENFQKDFPGQRLFHLNRSGYAGSPRYGTFPWSGDVSRSWDGLKAQLPLMQGMSISGIPYIHSDAGGFAGGDGDAELYVRWLQFADFTPIYRPHGTALGTLAPGAKDIPSEAALWPEPTKTRARNAAMIRYQWLPYNYTLCYQQTRNGKMLVTPMFFLNKADSNLYNAADQYMWGDEVMVLPITEKGQTSRKFYVPNGTWTNLNNFQTFTGPRWAVDSFINIESIPVFAREGSFIPFMPGMQSTADYPDRILNVLYIPSLNESSYELYEDDGKNSNALKTKQFELTSFHCSGVKHVTTITISSNAGNYPGRVENRKMVIAIPNTSRTPDEIKVDGKSIDLKNLWSPAARILNVPLIFRHTRTTIVINS